MVTNDQDIVLTTQSQCVDVFRERCQQFFLEHMIPPLIPEVCIHTGIDDAISLEFHNLVDIGNERRNLATGNTFSDNSLLLPTVSLDSDGSSSIPSLLACHQPPPSRVSWRHLHHWGKQ
jgi:hypothetical protein